MDDDTTICWGSATLYGFYEPVGAVLSWTPGSGISNPAIYNPEASPNNSTEYIFRVTDGECYNEDTVQVNVYERVIIDIQINGNDTNLFIGDFKQLIAIGGLNETTYSWYPNYEMSNPDTIAPIISPQRDTTYHVIATTGECQVHDSISLHVIKDLDPPTGFTPNGDGYNDKWVIDGIEGPGFERVEIKIFNRWGEIVFESSGTYTPWDGKNQKGKDLPIGTYYFVIDLNDERGTEPISGPLTIVR
jgi:gliding motility-associated-like protein